MPSNGTVDDIHALKSLLPFPLPKQQPVAHHSLCSFGGNLWRAFSKSANCSLHISLFKTVNFISVLFMLCSSETFPIIPLLPLSSCGPSWGNLKHEPQKGIACVLVVQAWQKTEIPGSVRQKYTPEQHFAVKHCKTSWAVELVNAALKHSEVMKTDLKIP